MLRSVDIFGAPLLDHAVISGNSDTLKTLLRIVTDKLMKQEVRYSERKLTRLGPKMFDKMHGICVSVVHSNIVLYFLPIGAEKCFLSKRSANNFVYRVRVRNFCWRCRADDKHHLQRHLIVCCVELYRDSQYRPAYKKHDFGLSSKSCPGRQHEVYFLLLDL